jgi:hypothetical protein
VLGLELEPEPGLELEPGLEPEPGLEQHKLPEAMPAMLELSPKLLDSVSFIPPNKYFRPLNI